MANPLYAQWVEVSPAPDGFLTDHTYGFGLDGKGYLVAGTDEVGNVRDDFYQYDPATDSFTQLDDFPGGARGFAIGDTWDGKAYFGFGLTSSNQLRRDLWSFDPATMEWTQLADCPGVPRFHPAMIAHNDKVYVGLGGGNNGNLKDWWIYDIATDAWSRGPDFPSIARHHPYQFGVGDHVYVGFGHGPNVNNQLVIFNEWYRYDPATEEWDEMATLPAEGRVAGQQFSHNDKGYVLSGEGRDHSAMEEGEFWAYDPVEDEWEAMPSHPGNSRWAPASFVVNDEVYIYNGIVYGFGPALSVEAAYKFKLDEGDVMASAPSLINNTQLFLSPNPANNFLLMEDHSRSLLTGQFTILDALGRTRMTFDFEGKKVIGINELENGVYILRAHDGSAAKQFIVAR